MEMIPLFDVLPEVAEKETRFVKILQEGAWEGAPVRGLPQGDYGFLECFCADPECDCRHAFIQVHEAGNPGEILATINYGWEKMSFYRKWLGKWATNADVKTFKGPALAPGTIQSEHAPALLGYFEMLLKDRAYVDRIARHYHQFKEATGGQKRKGARA